MKKTLLEDIQNKSAIETLNTLNKALKEKTLTAIGEARKQVAVDIFGSSDEPEGGVVSEARDPFGMGKKDLERLHGIDQSIKKEVAAKNGKKCSGGVTGHHVGLPHQYKNGKCKNCGKSPMDEGEHQEHRRAEAKMPISAKEKSQKRKDWDDDVRMPWPKDYSGGGRKDPGSRAGNSGAAMASHRFAESREVGKISFTEHNLAEELIHGKKLNPEQHKKVLNAYVHRYTGEHKPAWAKKTMPNGEACKPTHKTDKDWVHDHAFYFNKGTNNLSGRYQHAEPACLAEE